MLAQALGLVGCKSGLPEKLLRRSPLDISRPASQFRRSKAMPRNVLCWEATQLAGQLYTPSPAYFPVQRLGVAPNITFKDPLDMWKRLRLALTCSGAPRLRPVSCDVFSADALEGATAGHKGFGLCAWRRDQVGRRKDRTFCMPQPVELWCICETACSDTI